MSYISTLARLSPPELAAPSLQQRAAEGLFGDIRFRPDPKYVASLVDEGLTEEMIVSAGQAKGFRRPKMDLTLRELDMTLPFIHQMSDKLAEDHPDANLLFAGRDAEALYDDFAITHPDRTGHLLPASSDLWYASGMHDRELATGFLDRFGLSEAAVRNKHNKFVVVDSGFYGSIGGRIDEAVKRWHRVSILSTGAMCIKLVCTSSYSIGSRIMDFPGGSENFRPSRLPKVASWLGASALGSDQTENYGLCASLQLMPRFHDSYSRIAIHQGRPAAMPRDNPQISDNIDENGGRGRGFVNDSVVNPVAAAIIQYRVIKSAMERSRHHDWQIPSTVEIKIPTQRRIRLLRLAASIAKVIF